MTTYYMTSMSFSELGYWEKCNATTLSGAKREATAEYGAGYLDAKLVIAEGDGLTEPRREVAGKSNAPGTKWINYDA